MASDEIITEDVVKAVKNVIVERKGVKVVKSTVGVLLHDEDEDKNTMEKEGVKNNADKKKESDDIETEEVVKNVIVEIKGVEGVKNTVEVVLHDEDKDKNNEEKDGVKKMLTRRNKVTILKQKRW